MELTLDWLVPDVIAQQDSCDRSKSSSVTRRRRSARVRDVKTIAMLVLPIVAACGRMGFDPPPADPDPDAPLLDHLACGAPARFSVGDTTTRLGAITTPLGYDVVTVDDAGEVHGFTYEFETGQLVSRLSDVPLTSNALGPIGSLTLGDQLLLVVPYGVPAQTGPQLTPVGTRLIPLDVQLTKRAQVVEHEGWFGAFNSLAPTSSGKLAFLGQLANGEVDAKFVSPLGADLGAAHPVIDASERIGLQTILPTPAGFLVAWEADTPTPNEVRAEILDEQFAVQTPSTTISFETQFDSDIPRVAYSADSDTYVFAWMEKTSMGDQVWISVRDGSLRETQHLMLASGYAPAIVAGDNDFLIVWQDGSQLAAARITADGKVTPLRILGSASTNSKFTAWDLVVHNGQPAVAWVETGGTGANLRLDPLCN